MINLETEGTEGGGPGTSANKEYVLRLYIAGMTPNSLTAIKTIRDICEQHLDGKYDLQIIDIYKQPTLAKGEQIIAVPTLIKELPPPLRKFIGDLSETEKLILGLDIKRKERKP